MSNPYLLPNPSVVSFSGGRTSAYMLRMILDAFGGKLPDWVRVIFENTGKEREETLRFVERCSLEWDVPITWLEYRNVDGKHGFAEVNFATASRNGEPFEAIIRSRQMLPNPVARFCTVEMKIRRSNHYVRRVLGWGAYHDAIGLRRDEPKRVAKMLGNGLTATAHFADLFGKAPKGPRAPLTGATPICPLAKAGVTVEMVDAYWDASPFDLELRRDEGNCDLCFLKGAAKILRLIRERPESADWWIKMESMGLASKPGGATFRSDRPSYAELKRIALDPRTGPGWLFSDTPDTPCSEEANECRCTD